MEGRDDRLYSSQEAIEDDERVFVGFEVYDTEEKKIGVVADIFVDEDDRIEYLQVDVGRLWLPVGNPVSEPPASKLIPRAVFGLDEPGRRVAVTVHGEEVANGPAFDNIEDVTPEFEREVQAYYATAWANAVANAYATAQDTETDQSENDQSDTGQGREPSDGRDDGPHKKHPFLEDLTEEELAAMAGGQQISVAAYGSGLHDVSRDHDRYLSEGPVSKGTGG